MTEEKEIDVSAGSQLGESNDHVSSGFRDYDSKLFNKIWREITSDNHLTLFGFRRYRTTHLLNLRFLEAEIDQIDHDLYKAGLNLNQPLDGEHVIDRLGLKQARKDERVRAEDIVNRGLILRLRRLMKEYGKCDDWIEF